MSQALLDVLRVPLNYLGIWTVCMAAVLVLFFRVPKSWRMPLLALVSLLFLALTLKPALVVFFFTFCVILHTFCLTRKQPRKRATYIGMGLIALILIPFSLSRSYLDETGLVLQGTGAISAVLMVRFVRRAIFAVWEISTGRLSTLRISELVVYLLGLPFIIGRSPVFAASELFGHQVDKPLIRASLRTTSVAIGSGAVLLFLNILLPAMAIDLQWIDDAENWSTLYTWLILDLIYVRLYLHRMFEAQFAIGLAKLFGFQLRDNYQNPLVSRSYAELWRRWNIHFRDLLVGMFYYPVLLRLHRKRPEAKYRNVATAVVATYLGHVVFLIHSHSITLPTSNLNVQFEMGIGLVLYDCLQAFAVIGALCLPRFLPNALRGHHVLGAVVGVAFTFHLRSVLITLFRTGRPWMLEEMVPLLLRAFGF